MSNLSTIEPSPPVAEGLGEGEPFRLGRRRRFSLRTKLMLMMTGVSASALLVAFFSLVVSERNEQRRQVSQHLRELLSPLESLEATADTSALRAAATNLLSSVLEASDRISAPSAAWPRLVGFVLYDAEGSPIASRVSSLGAGGSVKERYAARLELIPEEGMELIRGQVVRYLCPLPAAIPGGNSKRLQDVQCVAALDAEYKLNARRPYQFLGFSIVLPVIAFLLSMLLSSRIESYISRPISQLAQTTLRVTEVKDYSPRLKHRRNDEIGDLVEGFNRMLAEIEKRDVALRQAQQQLEQKVQERTQTLRQEVEERRRTERDLAQQLARIHLLNQITQAIANRQDLASILSVVLGELTQHLPVDFSSVLLKDDTGEVMRVASCRERELETTHLVERIEDWTVLIPGSPWAESEPAALYVNGDLAASEVAIFKKPAELGMRSGGVIPLLYERTLTGVLLVARRSEQGFSPGERSFLTALTEHVALAGHQARLYVEIQSANQELRQTQQTVMQHERLRALGQMASGIAHDINNALSPIGGFAELLLATESQLSANARKHIAYIKTASDDIAHIVARLREFYRNREEQQPLAAVDPNALLREVVQLTRPRWRDLAQSRGADVEIRLDLENNPPPFMGIEAELREALTNLVFNSVDALPKGGTITLRSRTIHQPTSATPAGKPTHLVLEVQDTGTGMDEETRKRCLEPFFSTKGQRGTGLGLAMVYGAVQRHDGTIEIDSRPGRGTTMRIALPLGETANRAQQTAPSDSAPLRNLRVLFVDDEPLLRELIRELLESDGHEVITADGGQEALDTFSRLCVENRPPNVVITDLGMPQMDGRELTRRLKVKSPHTPIIMMTGWGKLMRAEEDLRAPVDALVSKPPRMAELQQALRDVLKPKPA